MMRFIDSYTGLIRCKVCRRWHYANLLISISCRKALAQAGTFVSVMKGHAVERAEDLILLKELVEEGKIRPVIDRCWPLEQIVEAHRYVESWHKKGNVVITVRQDEKER